MKRWLGRNAGLAVIVIAVAGTVFGIRQLELALDQRHTALLSAELQVAQLRDAAGGVYRQSQDALKTPLSTVGYERSEGLRASYISAAQRLDRSWTDALARRAATRASALADSVAWMLSLARGGQLDGATRINATVVAPAYAAATAAGDRAAKELARRAQDARSLERNSSLVAALAAGLLLLAVILGLWHARRKRDLAESERRALAEAEERLRTLVHNSSDMIVVVAPDSRVSYEAGAVREVLGVEPGELGGRQLVDWAEPDDASLLLSLCNTADHEDAEIRIRACDGTPRTCEIRATSLLDHPGWEGTVLHIWDVSERKALELELRLAQKLEAVGQLAAGIAHEINTPIQYVGDTARFIDNAFAELMPVLDAYSALFAAAQENAITAEILERVEEAEETADVKYLRERIPRACERTVDGVYRVSKIVRAMRAFAHPPSLEMTAVDINEAVRNTLIVATTEYKYVADVTTDLGQLPMVECNSGDINQVLLNLVINAAQAIAEVVDGDSERGSIHIRTWAEGDDVLISVADSGGGIPEDVAARIFDPFFTTKDVGRGTGQGLTISRTIVVERHGGSLTFETHVGEGTTFVVRLPVRRAEAVPPKRRLAA